MNLVGALSARLQEVTERFRKELGVFKLLQGQSPSEDTNLKGEVESSLVLASKGMISS
jgi:hypothetical protein